MTQSDLLVILNQIDLEKSELAKRLEEIKDIPDVETKNDAIDWLMIRYLNRFKAA